MKENIMQNIEDKIFNFIKKEKRGISTKEIAKAFFNIKEINKASEIIIEKSLKDNPKFKKNNDLWELNPNYEPEQNIKEKPLLFFLSQKFQPNLKEEFFLISTLKILKGKTQKHYFLVSDNIKLLKNKEEYLKTLIPEEPILCTVRKFINEIENLISDNPLIIFHYETGGYTILNILESGGLFLGETVKLSSLIKGLNLERNFFKREKREIEVVDITENISENIDYLFNLLEKYSITTPSELKEFLYLKNDPLDLSEKNFDRNFLSKLPNSSGVYFFKDKNGDIIYIGKSKNLKRRVNSYFSKRETEDEKLIKIQRLTHEIQIKNTYSDFEAIIEEAYLIKKIKPIINIKEEATLPPLEDPLNDNLIIFIPIEKENIVQLTLLNKEKGILLINGNKKDLSQNKILDLVNNFLFLQKTPEDIRFFGKDIIPFALRWLRLNHKKINFLKQGDFSSKKELVEKIMKYIEGGFKNKVYLY